MNLTILAHIYDGITAILGWTAAGRLLRWIDKRRNPPITWGCPHCDVSFSATFVASRKPADQDVLHRRIDELALAHLDRFHHEAGQP